MAANSGSLPKFLQRPTSYTTGVWGWITTVDHKKIGIMYGFTAIFFFLLGGLEAVIIRSQLAFADNEIVSPDIYNQLFTMHALTMIFLAIMPLAVTFFNLIVPLQIGARDVAFPRLNALSYWIYLSGGLLLNAGWILGGAADSGWFAYAPLTLDQYGSGGRGMDFYSLGLLVLGVSSVAGGLNFLVTIINMRAPGMTLMRMPVFTWMAFITSILLVTAMPVITIALIELALDRILGTQFFAPGAGGDPLLWQHLFWVFGHPEVYILILPAMGIVSEVLPTFSKKPLFGYPFIIFSGIFIGFMGWAVWSHHMFTVGMGPVANATFAITTMLIAVPTGVKIFNWIGTMWGGSIDFKTPMLFSIGFVFLFIIGGLSGVSHAAPPSDYQQQDTYYIVAHLHYVLFGGAIFGIFSGIYYWWPKFSGKLLNENLGVIHFVLLFIGMNMSFGPMHWLGMDGMPRRIYTYGAEYGWEFWNTVSTLGSYIIALGTIVFIVNVFYTMRQERRTDLADPWDGRTLEWSIPSPVPEYNFKEIPIVNGLDSFWDTKYSTDEQGYMTPIPQGASDDNQGDEEVDIHMPGLSYFPFITGIGLSVSGFGFAIYSQYNVVGLTIAIVGILATFFGAYGWCFEPADPEDHH
ncbi:MAG: cytochrome c oxidase subunit I [SAR202 cluster bacterium]|nr:cytochrome c oxidase subunit I [Chloroflexota bacterium]MQG50714.1 cytochrome c oxidase subunit I [SAR202 cluster bacterium]|tara:strand:- start:2301 stop:4199 length:1899 start_codon:yes stop_codon:yes gene_type:complete